MRHVSNIIQAKGLASLIRAINTALVRTGLPTIDPFSSVCDRLHLFCLGTRKTLVRSVRREFFSPPPSKTSLSSRIAGMQTLATEEGKQMVLSVTQSDGTNVKYLIKLPQADKLAETTKAQEAVTKGLILGAGETGHGFEHRQ
jgi:hypothetical protein